MFRSFRQLLLAGVLLCLAFNLLYGSTISSIQLVGNFNGITCHPEDPENDMTPSGVHEWVKLKFIDEPGAPPDTINFKFTKNHSYYPEHWGWSFEYGWGIAELAQSTSNIAAVLPDSGYYYFHFNDSTYEYSLDRPSGKLFGSLLSKELGVTPDGATVTLLDSEGAIIGNFNEFSDSLYSHNNLPPAVYSLYATASGCNDTTITNINLQADDSLRVDITLYKNTAVTISYASCERRDNEIVLSWSTGNDCTGTGFDIYRGKTSTYSNMDKRNTNPICGNGGYNFIDICEDNHSDYYYYIVEANEIYGVKYGPIIAQGSMPSADNALGQNYPNPFNPSTTVPYTIGEAGAASQVTISFFDVTGKMISRNELGKKPAGNYAFTWNPSESGKGNLPSGVYYCRLTIGKNAYSRKIILLR